MSTCIAQNYSDSKEYGIKGTIKIVKQYTYTDIIKNNNEYKVKNSKKWNSLKIVYFSKKGTIDSIKTIIQFKDNSEKKYTTKTFFEYKNNKKEIEKTYDENKNLLDSTVYKWKTDHNYTESIYDNSDELLSTSNLTLSKDYRDKEREDKIYKNKKIELWEKYENIIDDNGNFTKTILTNLLTSKKTELCYIYKDFDKNKNTKEIHIFDCTQNRIIKIRLNTYIYYN